MHPMSVALHMIGPDVFCHVAGHRILAKWRRCPHDEPLLSGQVQIGQDGVDCCRVKHATMQDWHRKNPKLGKPLN